MGSVEVYFWGLVWVIITVGGWLHFSGGLIEEFQLVRSGVSSPVYVGECFEEAVESESQGSGILTTCGYWFEVKGKTYTGGPETIFDDDTVIYLPENPTINRIKHAMGQGYWDFF
ncbi:MAG: hypothetical protein IPK01_14790 [Acidobacteria bacterium]|nr:hypothetical protein [Acidobacteriota bacterium]